MIRGFRIRALSYFSSSISFMKWRHNVVFLQPTSLVNTMNLFFPAMPYFRCWRASWCRTKVEKVWIRSNVERHLLETVETLIHVGKFFSKLGASCNYIFATVESLRVLSDRLRMRSIRIIERRMLIAFLVIVGFAGSYTLERYRKARSN